MTPYPVPTTAPTLDSRRGLGDRYDFNHEEQRPMNDDLLIDTPHGKKRWGFVRRAIESHDELLEALERI